MQAAPPGAAAPPVQLAPPDPPKPDPPEETPPPQPEPPPVAPAPAPDVPPPPPQTNLSPSEDTPPALEPPTIAPGAEPAPPPSAASTASNHVADVEAAPAKTPGSEEAVSAPARRRWQQELIAQIERHKHFPPGAQGRAGVVRVAFSIDEAGRLTSLRVADSSGSAILDDAAINLIRRAQPFSPPPQGLKASELSFVAPIRYLASGARYAARACLRIEDAPHAWWRLPSGGATRSRATSRITQRLPSRRTWTYPCALTARARLGAKVKTPKTICCVQRDFAFYGWSASIFGTDR
jgi:periplasmic protein TonB